MGANAKCTDRTRWAWFPIFMWHFTWFQSRVLQTWLEKKPKPCNRVEPRKSSSGKEEEQMGAAGKHLTAMLGEGCNRWQPTNVIYKWDGEEHFSIYMDLDIQTYFLWSMAIKMERVFYHPVGCENLIPLDVDNYLISGYKMDSQSLLILWL